MSVEIYKILNDFIKSPRFDSEEILRFCLWDMILKSMFSKCSIPYLPQLNLKSINHRILNLSVDGYVALEKNINTKDKTSFPFLLVEIDRMQLKDNFDHKDIVKLAVSMGAALKKLIGTCRYESREVLSNLCVFGLLIGGTQFDVCVIYADFGNASESEFGPGNIFPAFNLVFRYSREYWRFDLYGSQKINDRDTNLADYFFTEPIDVDKRKYHNISFQIIPPDLSWDRNKSSRKYKIESRHFFESIAQDNDINMPEQSISNSDWKMPNIINLQTIDILKSLVLIITNQIETFDSIIKSNNIILSPNYSSEEEKFMYSRRLSFLIPKGRRSSTSICSQMQLDSIECNLQSSWHEYQWKEVKKSDEIFKYKIYKLSMMPENFLKEISVLKALSIFPYFPSLKDISITSAFNVTYSVENVVLFDEFIEMFPDFWHSDREHLIHVTFLNILLDLMGALISMHNKGISHGNIYYGSIGWNIKKKLWQTFSFKSSKSNCDEFDKKRDFLMMFQTIEKLLEHKKNPLEPFKNFFAADAMYLEEFDVKKIFIIVFDAYVKALKSINIIDQTTDKSILAAQDVIAVLD